MADDFIGSIAQEDVDFITEIIKSAKIGDNYKHLVIYTDTTQVNASGKFTAYKDENDDTVFSMAEVTKDNYSDYIAANSTLGVWLSDYFNAGGQETVYIVNVDGTLSGDADTFYDDNTRLNAAFAKTKQLGYFKTVCIDTEDNTGAFALNTDAAVILATECAVDELLSAPPLLPYTSEVTAVGTLDDPAYVAVVGAGKDAFFSYSKVVTVDTSTYVHNTALVSLGLALSITNDSGEYVGNSFDMVKTDAVTIASIYGEPLAVGVQNKLKGANIQYWKPVGDSTGKVAARGASTINGQVVPAIWIVAFCNYYNKCQVASYITRRNVLKDSTTYNVLLSILATTVSKFTATGRVVNFALTAPAFSALPKTADDTIVVENAWAGYYVDDLRTVKIYGSLTM